MRLALLLTSVALIAGCNVHSKNPANSDGDVTIDADSNGEVNFNLPFANAKVKLPEGAMRNGNFDIDGVKLMPGSSITGFSVFARDQGSDVTMTFNAPASPDAVRAYFLDQFKTKGVEASPTADGLSGKSKDGNRFAIHLEPAGSGSKGKIEINADR
ncbi:MAG TPA: hypothetical protein VHM21_06820 [Sphingomicrobium sp.]|nr:hypothetical protein [Sphingomicrobium sp.]